MGGDDTDVVIEDADMSRWDRVEAKLDRWLDKWEVKIEDPKNIPNDLDERWDKLETKAEKWLENNTGKAGYDNASQDWDKLDARADKVLEKWESSVEGRVEDRLDSYETNADKLLKSWEKEPDRWEDRVKDHKYGKEFDDRIDGRLSQMEKRWERLDDKRACRIAKRFNSEGLASPDSLDKLQDKMIAAMI